MGSKPRNLQRVRLRSCFAKALEVKQWYFHLCGLSMQNFEETLKTLRAVCAELHERGVILQHLDDAVNELHKHHDNIVKVENNIRAIREEVIEPVKAELEQNKVAGRFSILGFWVGTAGFLISLLTIILTGISSWNSNRVIEDIVTRGTSRAPGQFSCEIIDNIPVTVVSHPTRGSIPIIKWESDFFSRESLTPEKRCIEASTRFQVSQEQGLLNYLTFIEENEITFVCASQKPASHDQDSCDIRLFQILPHQDPVNIIQTLNDINVNLAESPLIQ